MVANGQTVALSGSGTDLGLLGASQNGTATGTITVNYTDGTSHLHPEHGRLVRERPRHRRPDRDTTSSWNQSTRPARTR